MQITTSDGHVLPVRRLVRIDAAALRRFDAEVSAASRRWFLPHRYDNETVAKVLARSESLDDLVLGAFDGQRLVAYFFLWYFRGRVPLLGIGIVDDFHGRGLGRQIMGILIDEAKRAGRDGVELTTMQDNDRAFALYQKVGFRYLGNVENVVGDGSIAIERAMFYEIKPGARPMDGPHRPPV